MGRIKMEFSIAEKTSSIFNNVFIFFGTLSPQGFVLSLEGKIFEKTATDPKLLIGQRFAETVYWQSSPHTAETLERAIKEAAGGNSKAYLDFRVNAEEKIFIELSLQTVFDESSNTEQIFFCAQDVTSREKEIEHYKVRSEQLLYAAENAEIGLWFWNLLEDSIFTTPKCNEFFEVAPHDIITFESFLNVVHPDDLLRVETALRDSQTNGTEYNVEYRVLYSDGNIHWLAVRGKTYLNAEGSPESMMGVIRKITDKKVANEELAKVYEREKKARDEAESANHAKDFFLAVVSHELRSPLNTILGWTKILLTKEVKEDVRKNALETIEKSARSQAKLIDDLIDSARVSSGKLRLELRPTSIFDVLRNVFNSQKPLAQAKNINLQFTSNDEDVQVFGDAMRLQQIFTNLVSNALKFTQLGGNITIGAQSNEKEVTVFVKDDGQGISSESLPNIFQQFKQGDEKTSADHSGLGLGLSIVKILTEKHNGKIHVSSEGLGHGAIFTLTFPLCGADEVEVTKTVSAVQKTGKLLNGIKILVVEDDPDSREVLQLFLEQSGAEVESAECASEAMGVINESVKALPDVIVSDLAMPNEDGYSLLSRIRKLPNEKGGAIPAIALSAFASSINKKQAYEAGFQKYHTKPFEPDGIIQDILNLVKK
jgi:PAS domain S-box-containing protein